MFIKGQYLHEVSLLHGLRSITLECLSSSVFVLVEARTRLSERFLLRLSPKIISDSKIWREVLVLPKIWLGCGGYGW